jgi:predicted 3-demethylubiquinone-9 3-methyltransferase (glyoxalase superfamily)
MFAGEASVAMDLYSATFPSFRVEHLERYGPGEAGPEGSVKRAEASIDGHALIVIDSPVKHAFTFTACHVVVPRLREWGGAGVCIRQALRRRAGIHAARQL